MSSFDLIGESLGLALDCARRIAELSAGLIRNLQEPQEPIRRLRRNLPHLNKQAMAIFPGDEHLAADLRHELTCVEEDTFRMADWAARTQVELRDLFKLYGTDQDASERFGREIDEAFQESERLRQAVLESCNQAYTAANRVCAITDKAALDSLGDMTRMNPVAIDSDAKTSCPVHTEASASVEDDPVSATEMTPTNVVDGPELLPAQSRSILKKLRDLAAFDESNRQLGKAIGEALKAKRGYISRNARALIENGLVVSQAATNGGYWLTAKGIDWAAKLS